MSFRNENNIALVQLKGKAPRMGVLSSGYGRSITLNIPLCLPEPSVTEESLVSKIARIEGVTELRIISHRECSRLLKNGWMQLEDGSSMQIKGKTLYKSE